MNLNFLEEESAFIIEEQNDFLFDEEKILADFAKYDRLTRFVYHNHDEILWKNFNRKEKGRKNHPTGNRNVKRSKKLHKADRKHGKDRYKRIKKNNCCEILEGNIPSSKKFIDSTDEMNGSWIIMNRNKKVGRRAETLQKITYNRKTFRDRLNSAMDAREQDYILSPDPIEELRNAYWLYCDAECRLNHKADEPLFMHRTQKAYEEAIKEWEKLSEEANNSYLKVEGLLYSLGLDWNYFDFN